MPNVIVALPNICGALCSMPQSLAEAHYTRVPCSNAAKTRKPLKFAGVPQTRQQISAVRRPKFTIWTCGEDMWGRYRCLTSFFRLSIHASAAKIQSDKVVRWCQNGDFCVLYFQRAAHFISDMHSKFALRPHDVWKYPISDR